MNTTDRSAPRQSGSPDACAEAPRAATSGPKGWHVRKPVGPPRFVDSDGNPVRLGRGALALLEAIEGRARTKAYCWPSDATLASDHGTSVRAVQLHLKTLEDAGLITRVMMAGGKLVRLGIVLRQRFDADLPVASVEDDEAIVAELQRQWLKSHPRARGAKSGASMKEPTYSGTQVPTCSSTQVPAPQSITEKETHPSSSERDDDESRCAAGNTDASDEGRSTDLADLAREATDAVTRCFPALAEDFAGQLPALAERLATLRIPRRWDLYALAVFQTCRTARTKTVHNPLWHAATTAANLRNHIPQALKSYRDNLVNRGIVAPPPVPAPVAPPTEPEAMDRDQRRKCLSLEQRLATVAYLEAKAAELDASPHAMFRGQADACRDEVNEVRALAEQAGHVTTDTMALAG